MSQEDQQLVRKKLDLRAEGLKRLQALQEKRLPRAKTTLPQDEDSFLILSLLAPKMPERPTMDLA